MGNPITDPMNLPLQQFVPQKKAWEKVSSLHLETVGDLLRHYPRRYFDLGDLTPLPEVSVGDDVSFVGEVRSATTRTMKQRRGQILEVVVTDGLSSMNLTFFGKAVYYHQQVLTTGSRGVFGGKIGFYKGKRQLTHPTYEVLDESAEEDPDEAAEAFVRRPIPVYPLTSKITNLEVRRLVETVLKVVHRIEDPLPEELREEYGLPGLLESLRLVHRPDTDDDWQRGQRRLRWEEAFVLQTALARRRAREAGVDATPRAVRDGGLRAALDERLPFTLTAGQIEVGATIEADLASGHPMHRLLQGEVGSGKTLVALRAMLTVVDAGGQAALLAPTEVLAVQHHRSIRAMLGDLAEGGTLLGDSRGTQVELLTGSMNTAARKRALFGAASGDAGIVVGTHALLTDKVQFADLGLVVVDEQHRFGVEQRDALRAKGRTAPHLLVMTATPIPRTVAMTVFGDLETSTLRELPAGRSPISTHAVPTSKPQWVTRAWERVRAEIDAGHQAFVVCPRIGVDDEDADDAPSADDRPDDRPDELDGEEPEERRPARAVLTELAALRELPQLAGASIEMLHGRMPADERDAVMSRFTAGKIDVLVATTVIEVGVDVPNATTMVVLDADRFGVSQLHQLRGRVGRGSAPGLCFLVTDADDGPSVERLRAVAGTNDGFELARVDLEHRREGDVLGSRQSGGSSLRLLRVTKHGAIIEEAREAAVALVAGDPELEGHPLLAATLAAWLDEETEAYLERG